MTPEPGQPEQDLLISIINGEVFDSQGNQVTNDFDFTAVEDYFDFDDTFPDD